MKRMILISALLINYCDTPKTNYYQPPNPPEGIEIFNITQGTNTGDYLLVFRSENTTNTRFGGFYIFISDTMDSVLQMQSEDDDPYILGPRNSNGGTINYNLGIDNPIAILFSDNTNPDTSITIEQEVYSVTQTLSPEKIIPGNYLAMRTYLYDSVNGAVLEVSSPGNCIIIP